MLNLNRGNAIIKCIKCEVDISSRKKIVPSAKLCVECANDLEHQHKFLKFSKTK